MKQTVKGRVSARARAPEQVDFPRLISPLISFFFFLSLLFSHPSLRPLLRFLARPMYARVSFPLMSPGLLANVRVKTLRSESCYLCKKVRKRAPSWIFGAEVGAEIAEVRTGKLNFDLVRESAEKTRVAFEETLHLQHSNCTLRDYIVLQSIVFNYPTIIISFVPFAQNRLRSRTQ